MTNATFSDMSKWTKRTGKSAYKMKFSFLLTVCISLICRRNYKGPKTGDIMGARYKTCTTIYHDDAIKWKHFLWYWPLCGEFTGLRWIPPVTRSFDVFFDLRLIKRLSKHSRGWWFETLSRPLWRYCNVPKNISTNYCLCDILVKSSRQTSWQTQKHTQPTTE